MIKKCSEQLIALMAVVLCIGAFTTAVHGGEQTLDSMPSLFSDHRAYKVGQNVTVLIYEQASSTTSASRSTSKTLDVSGQIESTGDIDVGGVSLENSSTGQGVISREGKLIASVSATVMEIMPTGELKINGEQQIDFNNETQHIKVTGNIRSEDIRSDNTILSSRIAKAQITYVGDGLLGSRQKPGIITRFFNWLF